MAFESQAKLYCWHWQIAQIKLIKNAVRLILANFDMVGFLVFGRIPVDLSNFFFILSPKYFILKVLKRSFNKRNCIVDKSLTKLSN
jgi:hypothetical protein